ncbi:hypothetical protein V8F33_006664 [Rhypophila sp. PSN 637]
MFTENSIFRAQYSILLFLSSSYIPVASCASDRQQPRSTKSRQRRLNRSGGSVRTDRASLIRVRMLSVLHYAGMQIRAGRMRTSSTKDENGNTGHVTGAQKRQSISA